MTIPIVQLLYGPLLIASLGGRTYSSVCVVWNSTHCVTRRISSLKTQLWSTGHATVTGWRKMKTILKCKNGSATTVSNNNLKALQNKMLHLITLWCYTWKMYLPIYFRLSSYSNRYSKNYFDMLVCSWIPTVGRKIPAVKAVIFLVTTTGDVYFMYS